MNLSAAHRSRHRRALLLLALLGTIPLAIPLAGRAQTATSPADRVREAEEAAEAMRRHALAHVEEVELWQYRITSECMLEAARASAAGGEFDATESCRQVTDRILDEWRRAAPDSAAPELTRLFQMGMSPERDRAILDLLESYPDDAYLLSFATRILRHAGENDRATELLEDFRRRRPESSDAHRLLFEHARAQNHATRQIELLEDWAAARADDPRMLTAWLGSDLVRRRPEETRDRIDALLSDLPPAGPALFELCRQLAAPAWAEHRGGVAACLESHVTASDDFHRLGLQAGVVLGKLEVGRKPAADRLDEIAAIGDPQRRIGDLLDYVRERKIGCAERVDLFVRLLGGLRDLGDRGGSVASALRECAETPAATRFFLDALGRVEPLAARDLVGGWSQRVARGRDFGARVERVGPLPAAAAAELLAARLVDEPASLGLYEALDATLAHLDATTERLELFRRWRSGPAAAEPSPRIGGDLGSALLASGDSAGAEEVLSGRWSIRPEGETALLLWQALLELGRAEEARAFGEELARGGSSAGLIPVGKLLEARWAVLSGDWRAAESLYAEAAESERWKFERRSEYLGFLALADRDADVVPTARRLCQAGRLDPEVGAVDRCVAELLERIGDAHGAAWALAEAARKAPDDARLLAQVGRQRADLDLAGYALEFRVESDPGSDSAWSQLAAHFRLQADGDALEALLGRSRLQFEAPPLGVVAAVSQHRRTHGRPRAAIDLLLEARERIPAGGFTAGLDQELRTAYVALALESE
jgi:hypothetical protein